MSKEDLTLERVLQKFYYDEGDKTLPLIRKTSKNSACINYNQLFAGKRAGCITSQGYVHISIDNEVYKLHRIVYMIKEGVDYKDVPKTIDHIDRDVSNNLKHNLRDGSFQEDNSFTNSRNRESIGKSKYIGVCVNDT